MKVYFSCASGSQIKTCRELQYPHLQKLRHLQAWHEGQTTLLAEVA